MLGLADRRTGPAGSTFRVQSLLCHRATANALTDPATSHASTGELPHRCPASARAPLHSALSQRSFKNGTRILLLL